MERKEQQLKIPKKKTYIMRGSVYMYVKNENKK